MTLVGQRILRGVAGLGASREIVEPVVLPGGGSQFGTTLLGDHSVDDLKDLIKSGTYRVQQLANAYGVFAPTWVAKDPTTMGDWTNDWAAFQHRWETALAAANSKVNSLADSIGRIATLGLMGTSDTSAETEYIALAKAMRASYPPDGGPIAKGDYDDLLARLATAKGQTVAQAVDLSQMPQPQAKDVDLSVFKATKNADVIAMATGEQKPSGMLWDGPLGYLARVLVWTKNHPVATQWIIVGVAGGIAIGIVWPIISLPFKAAKGVAAIAGAAA